ncbi:CDP-glycerol glycerophosphotransferase family protein [Planococcus sp. YIM B11945]|uniref:CDP-glycerol glycerophosphotransferase family protein n=1 Tax=Planococcus sp. YIM B11945 TaxID=3435410 RepID=UPI003D7E0EB1
MKVYNNNIQILDESIQRIDFFESECGMEFTIELNYITNEKPLKIGRAPMDDQVLFSIPRGNFEVLVYVKSGEILAVLLQQEPNSSFKATATSYNLIFEPSSELISFTQTGETSFSIIDNSGKALFSIHDFAALHAPEYVYPVDLGLKTVEYRFLLLGKVQYAQYSAFVMYDLFRKELYTKNVQFDVESNAGGLDFKLISPELLEISAGADKIAIEFQKVTAKAKKIFEFYELSAMRKEHLLSIIEINGFHYYVHNRASGTFITRGNPTVATGFRAKMRARFMGSHLYIFGRNTHYAYRASGKYEHLYIEGTEEPIAKFKRPLDMKLLRRYGYFKVPVSSLNVDLNAPKNLYIGNGKEIIHNLKLKNGKQPARTTAFKKENGIVRFVSATPRGNISSGISEDMQQFAFSRRVADKLSGLKTNKRMLRAFRRIFVLIGRLPKKQKLVVFESFHAKQFSDSPRAIYEYMKDHHPDFKLLWSIDKDAEKMFRDFQVPFVRRFTFRWFLTFPRAKYWVNNVRLPSWMPKPHNTVYLQTWHGTPLKKLGIDIGEIHMPGTKTSTYKKNFVTEAAKWDYLVSPNAYSTEIFRRAFHYSGKVIESGYPRNDILTNPSEELTANLKKKLGIPAEKKIMLYAPTWRDNEFYQKGKYKFEFQFDLENWKKEFGQEWVLLSRMHYLVAENFDFSAHEGTVYDVSSYPDIRDLYLISDLMITDYSSVFFDYAILNRSIIFFMYDLEQYRDELRGFYIDMEKEAPGPIVQSEEALFQAMHEGATAAVETSHVFQAFRRKFAALEDGRATERVVKAFLDHTSE